MADREWGTDRMGMSMNGLLKEEGRRYADGGVKKYCEMSIVNHIGTIQRETSGGEYMRRCINDLCGIRGINEDVPSVSAVTVLDTDQKLNEKIGVELEPELIRRIKDVKHNTGLSKSDVRRICYLFQLESDIEEEERVADVKFTCIRIRNSFASLKAEFRAVLSVLFQLNREDTDSLIELDTTGRFDRFAHNYSEKLYGTSAYEQMYIELEKTPFQKTESMIEKHTDISFPELEIEALFS